MPKFDPLDVNGRLYRQIAALLDQLEQGAEEITIRERIAALVAVGRIQVIFMGLRKENIDEPANRGSKVRKYATIFPTANASRGRKRAVRYAKAASGADADDATILNALRSDSGGGDDD